MTRNDIIKRIEEIDDSLVFDISIDEITDKAREEAHICLMAAIDYIKENYDD